MSLCSNLVVIFDTEYRSAGKKDTENEEIIRCICRVLREEGDMLMCDKCEVRNHLNRRFAVHIDYLTALS